MGCQNVRLCLIEIIGTGYFTVFPLKLLQDAAIRNEELQDKVYGDINLN